MNKNKINTVIIGAQKAGTTSLFDWLGQHPDIDAPKTTKDFHFFTSEKYYNEGEQLWHKFYNKNSIIKLHAAVNYMYFKEQAAKRLYQYNPNLKIIVCLRNPANRAISAYKYFKRLAKEDLSFEEALGRELNDEVEQVRQGDQTYLAHGMYLEQIKYFYDYFNKSQFHYVFFEELLADSKKPEILKNIFDFLDVDSNFSINYTHLNKAGQLKSKFINKLLREEYPLKSLRKIIPISLRKRLGAKIHESNISKKNIDVKITEEQVQYLESYYKKSVRELEVFLNKDLSQLWCKK